MVHEIRQGEGGEQGDPLMPALFALDQHPALEAIQGTLQPSEILMAFLDDVDTSRPSGDGGTVVGDPIVRPCPDPGESEPNSSVEHVLNATICFAKMMGHQQRVTILWTPLGRAEFVEGQLAEN